MIDAKDIFTIMDKHLTFIMRLILFIVLHSFLAAPNIKERVMRFARLSQPAYRLGYNIISLLLFGWVMSAVGHSTIVYEIPGVARYILNLIQVIMLIALASCLLSTGLSSFLGFDALKADTGNKIPQTLTTTGWYGIVRHPLYLLSIIFMFSNPVMTVRWMILACIATLYFIIGALIEEKRLQKEFGEEYSRYREQVPFILPLPRNHAIPTR